MASSADVYMICKDHPRYKALRRPRVDCVVCWRKWVANQ